MPPIDPIRVLYIDDDLLLLELAKEWLEQSEVFQIEIATSGKEGLQLLGDSHFDAVICDYQMPGMDGIEVLKRIREGSTIPFILFTGKGREEVVIEALNEGADGYLQKGGDPRVQFAELEHKVQQAVQIKRSEVERCRIEQRFESLFNTMTSGSAIYAVRNDGMTGDDYIIRDFNRKALEIEGKTKAEVVGKSLRDLRPMIDHYGLIPIFRKVWVTGEPAFYPAKVYSDEKYFNWYQNTVFRLASGEIVSIYDDVTDQMKKDESLRQNEEMMRALVDANSDVIFSTDLDGRLIAVNLAMCRSLSMERDQLIGRTAFELGLPSINEEELVSLLRLIREKDCSVQTESMFLMPDGKVHTYEIRMSPLHDSENNIIGTAGVVRDITESRRIEKDIKRQKEYLSALFDSITDEIWVADEKGVFTLANPSALKEFGLSSITGIMDVRDLASKLEVLRADGSERPLEEAPPLRALKGEVIRNQEEIVRTPFSDQLRYRLVNSSPIIDADGHVEGVISVVRDITERRNAEEALRKGEERYRAYLEHSPVAFFIADQTENFLDVNRTACDMIGYTRSELLSMRISDLFPLEDRDEARGSVETLLKEGRFNNEMNLMRKDGEVLPVLLQAILLPNGMMMAFASDLTAKRKCDSALKRNEERFRAIVESSPTAMYFYHLEPDGRLIFTGANPSADKVIGIAHEILIGMTIEEAFPGLAGTMVPKMYRDVASGAIGAREFEIEYHEGKINGWFRVHVFKTEPECISVNFVDISESKEAERALRNSEERFRIVSENFPDHVVVQDLELRYTWVLNPQLGLTESEMIGRTDHDILPEEDADRLTQVKKEVLRSGQRKRFSTSIPSADGGLEYFDGVFVPIHDEKGSVRGLMGYFRNITNVVRTEEALLRANKKLNLLSSITRHDAKNKVTAIRGYAELLKLNGLPPATEDYVDKILSSVQTIDRQMEFTKLYQGVGEQKPVWQNLHDSVQKAVGSLILGELKIVEIDLEREVLADPMFERAVYNLIENCLRHGDGAKQMVISATEDHGELRIVFEDDGRGISPSDKANLFKQGYGKNTGFGLFLTREILDITGITIRENSSPGKGARFELVAPVRGWR
ncbi:MAG: PAS domain S-box protein [Methanomassiliicoccales archaeon]